MNIGTTTSVSISSLTGPKKTETGPDQDRFGPDCSGLTRSKGSPVLGPGIF